MSIEVIPTVIYSSMLGVVALALLATVVKPRQRQTTFLMVLLFKSQSYWRYSERRVVEE